MKKIICVLMAVMTLLSFAACGAGGQNASDELTLSAMMPMVLENVELPAVVDIEVTDENFASYLFIEPPAEYEALVSEAMMSAVAHSVVLLRVTDGSAASLAEDIRTNANPAKWICVNAEKTIVSQHGNTILLVMSTEDAANAIAANFDKLYE